MKEWEIKMQYDRVPQTLSLFVVAFSSLSNMQEIYQDHSLNQQPSATFLHYHQDLTLTMYTVVYFSPTLMALKRA